MFYLKAIIFDLDGVLINSIKYHVISWKTAFENHGIKVSEEELYLYEGMSFRETIDKISEKVNKKFTDKEKRLIYSDKIDIFTKMFELYIYPKIIDFLKFLKDKGLILAVVTGSNKNHTHKVLDENFTNLFDVIVTGEDVKFGKPAPDEYLKALKMLKIDANDAIVIENAPLGIMSAKNAGLKVYALETTLDKKYLMNADKIFKTHKELFEFVKEMF